SPSPTRCCWRGTGGAWGRSRATASITSTSSSSPRRGGARAPGGGQPRAASTPGRAAPTAAARADPSPGSPRGGGAGAAGGHSTAWAWRRSPNPGSDREQASDGADRSDPGARRSRATWSSAPSRARGATMTDDLVGKIVADGRYEIVRQLGQGGMGAVYLARQVAMDRMVALKLIRADAVKSKEAVGRFYREMKLTAKIEHPNTIRVYDFGQIDGQLFLTMELLRGRTLSSAIAESGRLPLARIVRIGTQVARALQAAHAEGVVHRDL